jgi:hypothetical protein
MSDKLKSQRATRDIFYDIAEMEDFFNSFIDVKELKTNKKNIEKIT